MWSEADACSNERAAQGERIQPPAADSDSTRAQEAMCRVLSDHLLRGAASASEVPSTGAEEVTSHEAERTER